MSPAKVGFSRPADKSLEAYKAWIRAMITKLGGEDDATDEQWEAGWREFWSDTEAPA